MRIRSSEITPKALYLRRREFLALGAGGAGALLLPARAGAAPAEVAHGRKLDGVKPGQPSTDEKKNSFDEITHYNNFYEFGTDKDDPARHGGKLQTRPWTVKIEGECEKPKTFDIDELLKFPLEERVYRLRCVEAWSMVIPWDGFPLAELLKKVGPTSRAKYLAFESAVQPQNMRGVGAFGAIPFPYLEGLRIDEAMNPLTLLAVGLYGEELPKPDGAPIRLVVPWKYGFKSAKSIVKIRLQETQPSTTWSQYAGGTEYGFYANVNPEVDHPRWSQAKERRIGEFFRRPTLKFNGYGDQVAKLYQGMDLRKFF
jgi:methionine sulfoxide reductase catalytic subunit